MAKNKKKLEEKTVAIKNDLDALFSKKSKKIKKNKRATEDTKTKEEIKKKDNK